VLLFLFLYLVHVLLHGAVITLCQLERNILFDSELAFFPSVILLSLDYSPKPVAPRRRRRRLWQFGAPARRRRRFSGPARRGVKRANGDITRHARNC